RRVAHAVRHRRVGPGTGLAAARHGSSVLAGPVPASVGRVTDPETVSDVVVRGGDGDHRVGGVQGDRGLVLWKVRLVVGRANVVQPRRAACDSGRRVRAGLGGSLRLAGVEAGTNSVR